jgi:dTDP-4-amino-4,6-dideoxygalactose transaminase
MPTFPGLEMEAVAEVLKSGWLTNGGHVRTFEQAFAAYQGVEHAVAVSSCTAALHLALLGHGIGRGDEVITSALTFAATCNAIVQAGARPVLVDVDPDTLNLDPGQVEQAITARTRAVIPVHFAGLPADLGPILALRERFRFVVIHDAAHGTEARWDGRSIGQQHDTACFSFYATKNLPIGEGGMLTTQNAVVADRARALRSHGMSADAYHRRDSLGRVSGAERWQHWDMIQPGYNYKMTELAALLGVGQLPYVEPWRVRRAALVARYQASLAGVPGIRVCGGSKAVTHAHHLFVIRLHDIGIERDVLVPRLRARGIEVAVNYRAVHALTWYRETFGWSPGDFPNAYRAGETCVTLPLHPEMSDADTDIVVDTLRSLLPA